MNRKGRWSDYLEDNSNSSVELGGFYKSTDEDHWPAPSLHERHHHHSHQRVDEVDGTPDEHTGDADEGHIRGKGGDTPED